MPESTDTRNRKGRDRGREAWVGGSISREELPGLWAAGVDAICIRGAACRPGSGPGRFGDLVATIPAAAQPEPTPLSLEER